MELVQTINLEFGRDTAQPTVFAKQGDAESRFIRIRPLNCGEPLTVEEGAKACLQLAKPDGHSVINDAVIEDGTILVELTQQILAAPGTAVAEIALYREGAILSSAWFYLSICPSACQSGEVESSAEYKSFENALAKVDGAANQGQADLPMQLIGTYEAEAGTKSFTIPVGKQYRDVLINLTLAGTGFSSGHIFFDDVVVATQTTGSHYSTNKGTFQFWIHDYGGYVDAVLKSVSYTTQISTAFTGSTINSLLQKGMPNEVTFYLRSGDVVIASGSAEVYAR